MKTDKKYENNKCDYRRFYGLFIKFTRFDTIREQVLTRSAINMYVCVLYFFLYVQVYASQIISFLTQILFLNSIFLFWIPNYSTVLVASTRHSSFSVKILTDSEPVGFLDNKIWNKNCWVNFGVVWTNSSDLSGEKTNKSGRLKSVGMTWKTKSVYL